MMWWSPSVSCLRLFCTHFIVAWAHCLTYSDVILIFNFFACRYTGVHQHGIKPEYIQQQVIGKSQRHHTMGKRGFSKAKNCNRRNDVTQAFTSWALLTRLESVLDLGAVSRQQISLHLSENKVDRIAAVLQATAITAQKNTDEIRHTMLTMLKRH